MPKFSKKSHPKHYSVWLNMRRRCYSPSSTHYEDYGGRNIRVCKDWRESFSHFMEDMGQRPTPNHTIDRIDNDGNYEPSNCRWATRREQAWNRRIYKNNTSGYQGVYFSKQKNKWVALIGTKPRKFLGYFDTTEKAAQAYVVAKQRFFDATQ